MSFLFSGWPSFLSYEEKEMPLRWGIAGAGNISHDFTVAIESLSESGQTVAAVAARTSKSAQQFAEKHDIAKVYGSYQELADDSDIDVVYVGTIHPTHLPVASLMINAGKPVICEKPLCMNVKETRKLVKLARDKGVFLMEALWSRCFPVYDQLRKELRAGTVGEVNQVMASFGQAASHVNRLRLKELGGGVTLDMGIYTVQLASMVFGGEKPQDVIAAGYLNKDGVDESVSATLLYSGGRMAILNSSAKVNLPSEAFVVGTKGIIKIEYPMWCPTTLVTTKQTFEFPLPEVSGEIIHVNSNGMVYEVQEVAKCLKKGLLESPLMTLSESLVLADIIERIRKQVGVIYPQDLPDSDDEAAANDDKDDDDDE